MAGDEERTYNFRIKYLTRECCHRRFRDIIEKKLKDKPFAEFLNGSGKKKEISSLHERRVLTDDDYNLLYRDDEDDQPSLDDADFTLLYILLRTLFCTQSSDDPIWYKDYKPEANDRSTAAFVVLLQNYISKLGEYTDKISKTDYEESLTNLSEIFKDLKASEIFANNYATAEHLPFDDETDNALHEEFGKWKEMRQRFESGLDLEINESKSWRLRLYTLLVDGGTRVFRHIFDDKVPPDQLQSTLANTKVKLKSLLNNSQKELLYPSHGCPKSSNFDITLLAILLRNICGFDPNDRCWIPRNIAPCDTSRIADIVRIRELRNKVISHLPQTGNLSEDDFERTWKNISEILVRLDSGCTAPLENLQSDIDKLKRKSLDPKLEKDLLCILKEWEKADDMLESKIMGYLQQSTLESSFELSKETVKDVLDDQYFVETEQFKAAKETLEQNRVIVLNGAPGEGKTTVAKKLLIEVSSNQRYIQLHSYAEWEKVNIDKVDSILIDDMFGSGFFDKEEYRKWQKHIPSIATAVKTKGLFVIITSRTYILKEALEKLFVQSIFTEKNIVTLSSIMLTESEKRDILEKHFAKASEENTLICDVTGKAGHSDIVKEIIELKLSGPEELGCLATCIGFPECARLFSSNHSLYEKGVEFFKDPMTCVQLYMSTLLEDDDTLIAFFVLWAQESKSLTSLDLERPIHDIAETINEPIRKLQFQPETHIRKIRHVLKQHRGGFIQFNDTEETFKFSHRVVQDAVGLVSYEINPTAVIELSDVPFIENFFCVSTSVVAEIKADKIVSSLRQRDRLKAPLKIHLSRARYSQISIRLGSIFIRSNANILENAATLFRLGIFDNQDFCSEFVNGLATEGCLQNFLNAKIRSLRSEFAEFKFLNNVAVENMGIIAYLIWMKEDVSPLMETCLQKMMSLELSIIKKELNISFLISVKLGSCKLVKYLLEKGAEVDFSHVSLAIVTDRSEILEQFSKTEELIPKINILHKACMLGYVQVVSKLLKDDLDLTQPGSNGKSLIENAIVGGNVDIFEQLLSRHIPLLSIVDGKGNELPLYHFIISKQNPGFIDVLTEKEIRPTKIDRRQGRTPFLYAIQLGKFSVIDKLLQLSIEDNVHCLPDIDQNTPLYITLSKLVNSTGTEKKKYIQLALKLCRFSENMHLKSRNRENSLELACKLGLVEIVNAILEHGDPYHNEGSSLIHHFVTTDNEKGISTLLQCNIDPNTHDGTHRTPFMLANVLGKRRISAMLMTDPRIEN